MSLLTMSGRLINVFQTPKGNRDGKDFGGQDKIQVLGAVTLQNGEVKKPAYRPDLSRCFIV